MKKYKAAVYIIVAILAATAVSLFTFYYPHRLFKNASEIKIETISTGGKIYVDPEYDQLNWLIGSTGNAYALNMRGNKIEDILLTLQAKRQLVTLLPEGKGREEDIRITMDDPTSDDYNDYWLLTLRKDGTGQLFMPGKTKVSFISGDFGSYYFFCGERILNSNEAFQAIITSLEEVD